MAESPSQNEIRAAAAIPSAAISRTLLTLECSTLILYWFSRELNERVS